MSITANTERSSGSQCRSTKLPIRRPADDAAVFDDIDPPCGCVSYARDGSRLGSSATRIHTFALRKGTDSSPNSTMSVLSSSSPRGITSAHEPEYGRETRATPDERTAIMRRAIIRTAVTIRPVLALDATTRERMWALYEPHHHTDRAEFDRRLATTSSQSCPRRMNCSMTLDMSNDLPPCTGGWSTNDFTCSAMSLLIGPISQDTFCIRCP